MSTAQATLEAAYQTALAMLIGKCPRRRGPDRHALTDDELLSIYRSNLRLHNHVWAALGWRKGASSGERAAWYMSVLVPILRMAYEGRREEFHRLLERCLNYPSDISQVRFEDVLLPSDSDRRNDRPLGRPLPDAIPLDRSEAIRRIAAVLLYLTGAWAAFREGDRVVIWVSAAQASAVLRCTRANIFQAVRDYGEPTQLVVRAQRAKPSDGEGLSGLRTVTLPGGQSHQTRVGAPAYVPNEYVVKVTGEILQLARELADRQGPVLDPVAYEMVTDDVYNEVQREVLRTKQHGNKTRHLKDAAVAKWKEIREAMVQGQVQDSRRRLLDWLIPAYFDGSRLVLRGPVYPSMAALIRRYAGGDITVRFALS